ncbi:MAG: DUF1570 domain-containing protein [Planctomycetaceae bacterium]|nr:DUF1570 domain-containing protein [Planctomycetaceae bacterium]
MRPVLALLLIAICTDFGAGDACADTFVYTDEQGEQQTVEARLFASGQDAHALLKADGRMEVVPQAVVEKREPADGPAPLTPEQMAEVLKERFDADRLRTHTDDKHVIALLTAGPLDRRGETRAKGFLQKVGRFMDNVDTVFTRFARDMRFPLHDQEFPLVTIVFESDDDFNKFTEENTGGDGLSAKHIAGFYSPLTNWLAIRLEECRTFRVPLHEAIHQQMYNRVFQRLAPIPTWFDEGIATGFENNGEKVDIHPAKINGMYAWLSKNIPSDDVKWADIVNNDDSFQGDILAAESYIEAWSLHWMLVTQHEEAYAKYVQQLAARTPLEEQPAEQRTAQFAEIFGKSVEEIAREFPRVLEVGMKRQKVKPPQDTPDGLSLTNSHLAEVKIFAELDGGSGQMQMSGQIKNESPIRPMTYHIAVVTSSGTYTDWVIDSLEVNGTSPLPAKIAAKVLPGTLGGPASRFVVRIRSALPGSETAQQWDRSPPLPEGFDESEEE